MSGAVWAVLATLGVTFCAGPTCAKPNLWQRAREPAAASQEQSLIRIERLLSAVGLLAFDAEFSAGAVALSELAHAPWPCLARHRSTSERAPAADFVLDARIEYLLGEALLNSQTGREAEARCMLERALRDAPDSPLAARGLAELANAAAKLGDRGAERSAYLGALERTWDPDSRGNLLANLAESEMALGNLRGAVRGYQDALRCSLQPELLASAYFGLAVALDRSGDLPSALRAAKQAISVQLPPTSFPVASVLDLPNVFFTPHYEVYYYKALGAMAAAQLAKDDRARQEALSDAAEQWGQYLIPAERDHSNFAPRAALHQASVVRQLAAVSAKLPSNSPSIEVPERLPP